MVRQFFLTSLSILLPIFKLSRYIKIFENVDYFGSSFKISFFYVSFLRDYPIEKNYYSAGFLSPPKIFVFENLEMLYFDLSHLKISINLMFLVFCKLTKNQGSVELTQL